MTKIKLCGLTRLCDIESANELMPDYIGFVFAKKSRRYIDPKRAWELKNKLYSGILTIGVFVNEEPEKVAELLESGLIWAAQLHGAEDEAYIKKLRSLTDKPLVKAFRIEGKEDVKRTENSSADYVLLDSGTGGTGTTFDWDLIKNLSRPYFLAGGLDEKKVKKAVEELFPFGVDVSSGIETNGLKDKEKMAGFVCAVRTAKRKEEMQ